MSIWGNRDYFKDYFWMIEGGLSIYGDCLISNGSLQNATFLRASTLSLDNGESFGVNVPPRFEGKYLSHGGVSDTFPSYDISPIERPTAPDVIPAPSCEWSSSNKENQWVFNLLQSIGTIGSKNLIIKPSTSQWKTSGNMSLLSGETDNPILYVEAVTGLVCATDGVNTCKSLQPYTEGVAHNISLAFGDGKMQIYLDKINGARTAFTGTFSPGNIVSWCKNEDIIFVEDVCGRATASFSDAIHLAQFLAQDL